MPWLKALALWVLFLVFAIALAGVRETWLAPTMGDSRAHQAETLAFCAVIAVIVLFGVRWMRVTRAQGLRVGASWVAMTLLFEFGVFGVLLRHPWPELLADYNIFEGRLWPLVLATELVAPWIFGRDSKESDA
jgi:hypothetical protein